MSSIVEFHPQAAAEVADAYEWYARRSEKAAGRIIKEMDHAVENIGQHPDRYPRHSRGTRVYLLRRFPYLVIYKDYSGIPKVVAVAHARRRPGYWKQRLKPQ